MLDRIKAEREEQAQRFAEARKDAKYAVVQVSERTYDLILLGDEAFFYLGVPVINAHRIAHGNWGTIMRALPDASTSEA